MTEIDFIEYLKREYPEVVRRATAELEEQIFNMWYYGEKDEINTRS